MNRQLFGLLFFFFFSIFSRADTLTYQDKLFVYRVTLDSAITTDSVYYDCFVKEIIIEKKADKKIVQKIVPGEHGFFCSISGNQVFIVEDMNFDGFNDFRLLQFLPAAPNLPYYFWICDPKTLMFKPDTALEKVSSPEFDQKTKTIFSNWRNGCCNHGLDTYKYINGRLVLVEQKELISDTDTKKETMIERKLVEGKFKEVSRTTD